MGICPIIFAQKDKTGRMMANCLKDKCAWYFKPDTPNAKGSCSIKIIAAELTGIQLRLIKKR